MWRNDRRRKKRFVEHVLQTNDIEPCERERRSFGNIFKTEHKPTGRNAI